MGRNVVELLYVSFVLLVCVEEDYNNKKSNRLSVAESYTERGEIKRLIFP